MAKTSVVVGIVVVSVVIGLLSASAALIAKCFRKLDSDEMAILYNTYNNILGDKVYSEGLHVGSPTANFKKFPSVFQTLNFNNQPCLNKDGVFVTLTIGFQYRARSTALKRILLDFQNEENYVTVLSNLGRKAIFDACVQFNTTQFQSQRGAFQEVLTQSVVKSFSTLWTDVTDLQVRNVARPHAYERTIQAKESAREDIEVAHSEGPRQLTEARTSLRQAKTEAEIIVHKAQSEARIQQIRAEGQATGVLNKYRQEAQSFKSLKEANDLTTEAFLSYMAVRVIADSSNPVSIGIKAPAKTSYFD